MTATLEPATESVIKPHRFTVDDFQKMFEHGIVSRRSQLIRGEIYFTAAMGAAHANAITVLTELLVQSYSKRARVSPQCPIVIWMIPNLNRILRSSNATQNEDLLRPKTYCLPLKSVTAP